MILTRRPEIVAVRCGTGPLHLAIATRAGYRAACGRRITGARATVCHRKAWTASYWRPCGSCSSLAERTRTDSELRQAAAW